MVRGTKGTARHECTAALRLASDGMDARDLKRFLDGQRRKDGRDSPREHRLARTRTSNHEHIVPAGNGNLKRTFRRILSLHIREVIVGITLAFDKTRKIGVARFDLKLPVQIPHGLLQQLRY